MTNSKAVFNNLSLIIDVWIHCFFLNKCTDFNNTLKSNTIWCKKLTTILLGWKNVARPFFRQKQVSTSAERQQQHVAVAFRLSCLPVFAWRRVVLRFFNSKQLLRVSCILWWYYPKYYSIILENVSLWCFIVI